jgi:hypothetical protein
LLNVLSANLANFDFKKPVKLIMIALRFLCVERPF